MNQIYYYAGRLYLTVKCLITKDGVQSSVEYIKPVGGGKWIEFSQALNVGPPIYVSDRILCLLSGIYSYAIYQPESYSFPTLSQLLCIISSDIKITDAAGSGTNSLPVVVSFKDLHIPANLELAKTSLKGLSGIYCFRHIASGRIYIGQAMDLSVRIIQHLNDFSSNIILQRALNKHGLEAFEFLVVEFVTETSLLTTREQLHLDWLFNLSSEFRYNICPTASSMLGYTHTAEAKAAIGAKTSVALLGNTNCVGIIISAKTKAAIGAANSGVNHPMYGKTHSAETKAAMSAAKFGTTHTAESIEQIRINQPSRMSIFVYELLRDSVGSRLCKGRDPTWGRYPQP